MTTQEKQLAIAEIFIQAAEDADNLFTEAYPRKWIFRPKKRRPMTKRRQFATMARMALNGRFASLDVMRILSQPIPPYPPGTAIVKEDGPEYFYFDIG